MFSPIIIMVACILALLKAYSSAEMFFPMKTIFLYSFRQHLRGMPYPFSFILSSISPFDRCMSMGQVPIDTLSSNILPSFMSCRVRV